MSHNQELALTDFGQFFPQEEIFLPKKREYLGFKLLVIGLVLLFSVISLPWQGAAEGSLTADNLLYLTNQDRAQNGMKPLRPSLKLAKAAEEKARDMIKNNYFAHTSPSGLEPWHFITSQNFQYIFAGENLAINYTNPYELEADLMNSKSHRENILSPIFTDTGIAIVSGTFKGRPAVITVQMFGNATSP